ncbi:MAG TPA: toxin TcdB middle/N-terminal domain-containing protein [Planctomycetota bacterium]
MTLLVVPVRSQDALFNTSSTSSPGETTRRVNFGTDLFTGRFVYSIPIEVPPARQGMAPALSLSYDSSRSNGVVGVGWAFDQPMIQRDTREGVPVEWKNLAQTLKAYDDSKGFIFSFGGSSSALVPVALTSPPFGVYRAEVDRDFLKFEYLPTGHWKITERNGTVSTLGQFAALRSILFGGAPGVAGRDKFRWYIESSIDANQNRIDYTYRTFPDSVELFPDQILYGGHGASGPFNHNCKVQFGYSTEPRSDLILSYESGFRVQCTRLLTSLTVRGKDDVLVRKYELQYAPSPTSGRARLSSVQEVGTTGEAYPATTFEYTEQQLLFLPEQTWGGLLPEVADRGWASVRGSANPNQMDTHVGLEDMNGDGLTDRVQRREGAGSAYLVQYNTGLGSFSLPFSRAFVHQANELRWESLAYTDLSGGSVRSMLMDLDRNGFPDRVEAHQPSWQPKLRANLFDGNEFAADIQGFEQMTHNPITTPPGLETNEQYVNPIGAHSGETKSTLIDMNGDLRPDRVYSDAIGAAFYVQFSTGVSGSLFGPPQLWPNLQYTLASLEGDDGWRDPFFVSGGDTIVGLFDMNGDRLPDRVMTRPSTPTLGFRIQYNNGLGFDDLEVSDWGPLESGPGNTGSTTNSPVCRENSDDNPTSFTFATMVDMNNDGLLDRLVRRFASPFAWFSVQFNNGNGPQPAQDFGPLQCQGNPGDLKWSSPSSTDANHDVVVDLEDMNGDGLVDRVMRNAVLDDSNGNNDVFGTLVVALSQGPVPDLLNVVHNGTGGRIEVGYAPSGTVDNHQEPWTTELERFQDNVGLLPFPVQTVRTVSEIDEMDPLASSSTTYSYAGGFYDTSSREFRGFWRVIEEGLFGEKKITYFHQGGGRDDAENGEWEDTSKAKAGLPYRTEILGPFGKFTETLNKVGVLQPEALGQPLWTFPVVEQVVTTDYESSATVVPRSRGKRYEFDLQRGLLQREIDLGEVADFDPETHALDDIGTDTTIAEYDYAAIQDNDSILDKVERIRMSADGLLIQRDIRFEYYPGTGNLWRRKEWLDDNGVFLDEIFSYGFGGNLVSQTSPAGAVTTTFYDTVYQKFPATVTTGSIEPQVFVTQYTHDHDGSVKTVRDQRGMLTEYTYDGLHRVTHERCSVTPGGPATLLKHRYEYHLDGVDPQESSNFVLHEAIDGIDSAQGHQTFTYADGFGRTVQVREESERTVSSQVQFRVTDTFYDRKGNVAFRTLPYFSSGGEFSLRRDSSAAQGIVTEYDARSRPTISYSSLGGDGTNSPSGLETRSYGDGTDPWTTVVVDAEGKIKKARRDALGRLTEVVEVLSGADKITDYDYDNLGNLLSTTDSESHTTTYDYNSLGQRTSMVDPNLGSWSYTFDDFGRAETQTDAKNNVTTNQYDLFGRVRQVDILNGVTGASSSIVYTYDQSGDGAHAVYKGQLYRVDDPEGSTRFSYDHRDRLLKKTRYLAFNGQTYATQYLYNDADRLIRLTYPQGYGGISYAYDTTGHTVSASAWHNTTQPVTFYQAGLFNERGQLESAIFGNQVSTTYSYYERTSRLMRVVTGGVQDLSYTYDRVGNVRSIADLLHDPGESGSLGDIQYDDLHRMKQYTRGGQKNVTYSPAGNILTNDEYGVQYEYLGPRPQAVTRISAYGGSPAYLYTYDANGNMRIRSHKGQTLTHDALNRLTTIAAASYTITYRYAYDGSRLARQSGSSTTIWIEDGFEVRDGQVYGHVFVDGRRVCTFTPYQHLFSNGTLAGEFTYLHPDRMGNTNVATDKNGAVVSHFEYNPFGNSYFASDSTSSGSAYRFSDQHYDADADLYFFGARYYDATIGRFLEPDQVIGNLGDPQALNRYAYARNNPLRYADPSGNAFDFGALFWTALVYGLLEGGSAALQGEDFWDGFKKGFVNGAIGATVSQFADSSWLKVIDNTAQVLDAIPGTDITEGWAGKVHGWVEFTRVDHNPNFTKFVKEVGRNAGEFADSLILNGARHLTEAAAIEVLRLNSAGADFSDLVRSAIRDSASGAYRDGLKAFIPTLNDKDYQNGKVDAVTLRSLGQQAAKDLGDPARDYLDAHIGAYLYNGSLAPPYWRDGASRRSWLDAVFVGPKPRHALSGEIGSRVAPRRP